MGLTRSQGDRKLLDQEDSLQSPALEEAAVEEQEEAGRVEAELDMAAADARYLAAEGVGRSGHCREKGSGSTPGPAAAWLSLEDGEEDNCVTEGSRLAAYGG